MEQNGGKNFVKSNFSLRRWYSVVAVWVGGTFGNDLWVETAYLDMIS